MGGLGIGFKGCLNWARGKGVRVWTGSRLNLGEARRAALRRRDEQASFRYTRLWESDILVPGVHPIG
jgi:hypothetical protein